MAKVIFEYYSETGVVSQDLRDSGIWITRLARYNRLITVSPGVKLKRPPASLKDLYYVCDLELDTDRIINMKPQLVN